MIDAERVRAALAEAGRPDLAQMIGTNKRGFAMMGPAVRHYCAESDLHLILKALTLSRGPDWAARTLGHHDPDQFVRECRGSSTDTHDGPRHWCPLSEVWRDRFHRRCCRECERLRSARRRAVGSRR